MPRKRRKADTFFKQKKEEAAEHFKATYAALDRGDFQQGITTMEQLAAKGYGIAQNWLGNCYYHGKGVPQDYDKAVSWYKKAAAQTYAEAKKKGY